MKQVPAAGPVTYGLDVSHYQGLCDFKYMAGLNVKFVISKCTENTVDDTYAKDRVNAKQHGMIFGAYDFLHPSHDPVAQALLFLRNANIQKGDIIPMLDWETTDGLPRVGDIERAKVWLDTVEKATGRPPMIYSYTSFLKALNLDASYKRYPLVISNPSSLSPLVPEPWETWTIHQYSWRGSVPGINEKVDLDRFNGSDMSSIIL